MLSAPSSACELQGVSPAGTFSPRSCLWQKQVSSGVQELQLCRGHLLPQPSHPRSLPAHSPPRGLSQPRHTKGGCGRCSPDLVWAFSLTAHWCALYFLVYLHLAASPECNVSFSKPVPVLRSAPFHVHLERCLSPRKGLHRRPLVMSERMNMSSLGNSPWSALACQLF